LDSPPPPRRNIDIFFKKRYIIIRIWVKTAEREYFPENTMLLAFPQRGGKLEHKEKLMKNKILILALLVVFVSVSFMGCGGDSPKAIKAKDITVEPYSISITGDALGPVDNGYILRWEAKGKNVADYIIYAKKEDNASVKDVGTIVTNEVTYTSGSNVFDYGGYSPRYTKNDNFDKWNGIISSDSFTTELPTSPRTYADYDGDYYFGVRTVSIDGNDYSKIVWTKEKYTITVPKGHR
jgi:hypothetical protein